MTDIAPIRKKIIIEKTTGEGGNDLHHCYFLATDDGVYNLYTQHSTILAANIVSGQNFNFTLDDIHFEITNFRIDSLAANGNWKNDVAEPAGSQDGTFQAQSGGGVETDDDVETVAACVPPDAIKMKNVTGGSDKDKLKHCYFVPDEPGGPYTFYDKDCNVLASNLTSGDDFGFSHDSISDWSVTNFLIDDTNASGDWSNPNNISITDTQDGTFQAQSGGGIEETATAAKA